MDVPPATGQGAIGHDESPVHNWRVSQLERLGVPGPLAEGLSAVALIALFAPMARSTKRSTTYYVR